jgi:exodeoxyribonuclease (lambda-induced)
VQEVGFIKDLHIEGLGCSPDGLTSDGGIVEIKCPNSNQHVSYYREKRLPLKYRAQVMCQMAVTGVEHAYFVSFDDRVPVHLQLSIVKVQRDEDYINDMLSKSRAFLAELESLMEEFKHAETNYMSRLAF